MVSFRLDQLRVSAYNLFSFFCLSYLSVTTTGTLQMLARQWRVLKQDPESTVPFGSWRWLSSSSVSSPFLLSVSKYQQAYTSHLFVWGP